MVRNIAILLCLALFFNCKPKQGAGLGGNISLIVYPQHHGRPINNCRAFLKFNTQDAPNGDTSQYDAKFFGDKHTNHINCSGLNSGQYYVYVYGWDTLINQPVHGGLPLDLTGSSSFTIPISE